MKKPIVAADSYIVDFSARKVFATASFMEKAGQYGSEEYNAIKAIYKDFPGFDFVTIDEKKKRNKKDACDIGSMVEAEKSVASSEPGEKIIQFYQNKNNTVINAYDHVVFNLIEEQTLHSHKSFVFCGCEPQVGTTSIVIELGILLAHLGKRVLILDGDFRRLSSHKRLHDIAELGVSDYVRDPEITLEDCIYGSNVEGLFALSSGKTDNHHARQILYSSRFKEALDQLKQQFDFILIDSCALDTTSDVLALASFSDAVVLVCALNGSPKSKLSKAYQKLTKIKCNLIGVIENMVDMHEYETYMDDYDYYTLLSDAPAKKSRT